jgi:FtsP/CotA-like multicopper oxidase with cupredoxin domain
MTRRLAILVVMLAVAGTALAAFTPGAATGAQSDSSGKLHPTPTTTPTGGGGGAEMRMQRSANGLVVNANTERLPPGCSDISGTREVTVRAGRRYASGGNAFSFDRDQLQVAPCTRVRVTLVNEDSVRHQWMVHGLPRETYARGMFTVEVDGPGRLTGSFVTPAGNQSLHVHCSLPQHEQKGMHQSLVVGSGVSNGHTHGTGGGTRAHSSPGMGGAGTTAGSGALPASGVGVAVVALLCWAGLARR